MAKDLYFNDEARKKLFDGIKKVADAVKVTLGPAGKLVILQKENGSPIVTKDGVTVAKEIILEDPVENLGASLIKEVAAKTNAIAGDNTTTSTVLAYAIVKEGMRAINNGINPTLLKSGMDKSVDDLVKELKSNSKEIEDSKEITQVATISANNDSEIGKILAEAVEKVGKDGVILVEESQNIETSVKIVNGLQWEQGYISPYFCTNKERMEIEYDDCNILVTENKISAINDIIPIIDPIAKSGKPLLIICDDMDGEALGTLIVNSLRGTLKVAVVKAPSFGEERKKILQDIAIVCGATIISDDYNISLSKATPEMLGKAKIKINKSSTTITNGNGNKEEINKHIEEIKAQIDNTKEKYDKDKLKKRLARLTGGVAVISVGAPTVTELKEKKFRVEDTIAATRSAIEEGIIPGGGVALVNAATAIWKTDFPDSLNSDEIVGYNIILSAVTEPLKQIAENSGISGDVVLNKIYDIDTFGVGYNVMKKVYEPMIESGIIDTTKAIKSALINAASIAGIILTTECTVTDIPKKANEMQLEVQQQPFMM